MSSLRYEKKGKIAYLILNRPEVMNALDPELQHLLAEAWVDFANDPEVWVAILTGTGEKAFCTGADLKKTLPPRETFAMQMFGTRDKIPQITPSLNQWKPVICAINGYAVGGGLELALSCDLIIASENARFGLPEVKIASIPGAGGTQRLPRKIPHAVAMKMLLTGDSIDAQEAYRIGLIAELVPQEELLTCAEKLAKRICENGPLAVRSVKMAVTRGLEMSLDQGLELEKLLWGVLRDTEDRIEGRVAFAEKRNPIYKGM